MMKYSFLIFCVLSALLPARAAGTDRLQGKVYDSDTGEPIAGVVVRALNGRGKLVSFSSTEKSGTFTLKITSDIDSLSFRCMGYETISMGVDADYSEVRLTPRSTLLKDVIVDAPDIYARGDTLVFNVAKYASAKDNAIIDVIKRLPGIKVEDDGTILYQGKPINKFYLDGNDFIDGQYGLATNNISHKDVKSVEVMENHQPVKALEGIEFPEEAGINLKLKDNARSRWVGVAQGDTGFEPFLYSGSLFTMRLASKVQNMFTFKVNNTGWNPASQIKEHDFDGMFASDYSQSLWKEYITADAVDVPLSEKRTRDNLSWIANGIASWKRGDASMRLKLNYVGDRLDYGSGVVTDYFSEVIPTFRQNNELRTMNHELSGQFYSEINKRGYYLKDKLTVSYVVDDSRSAITGSFNLTQQTRQSRFSAGNDLKLVKRNDTKVFTLTSRNMFYHSPDKLTVSGDGIAVQTVRATDFRSTTETQFGKLGRFWKAYVVAGVDLDYHRSHNSLAGMEAYDNSENYGAFLSNIYATPRLDYERNGWRLSLTSSIKWIHHSLIARRDYINLLPRIYARKQVTSKSEISASIAYRLGSPQAYMDMEAPVLCDYRNLFIAKSVGGYNQSIGATMSYRYRNPLKSLFVNASATYNYQKSSAMSNQLFVEDFVITTFSDKVSAVKTRYFNAGLSKGLGRSRMVTGCDIKVSSTSAVSMRDNEEVPFKQFSLNIKPYFKGSLLSWLSMDYGASYSYSRLRFKDADNNNQSLSQNLFFTILPADALQFTAGAEHFITCFPDKSLANIVLLDASATWKITDGTRLSLTANNLLDRRKYEYVNYGTLSKSEYSFRLRPRNILLSLQVRF